MDKLFDVFCADRVSRRKLKVQHEMLMTAKDYEFYHDKKTSFK